MADEGHRNGDNHDDVNIAFRNADQLVYDDVKHSRFRQDAEIKHCEDTEQHRIKRAADPRRRKAHDVIERVPA